MDMYRKIAIVLIVFLFSYILFRLVSQRIIFRKEEKTKGFAEGIEGFAEGTEGFAPQNTRVLAIQKANTIPPNITIMNNNIISRPLYKTYIKSAYGGGYDGDDISNDMMNYTLSLGYRYVVIHVFYDMVTDGNVPKLSESKTAIVGFSSGYSPLVNTAKKTISLYDFIQNVQQNAFSSTSPNSGDPFFLHILPGYQKVASDTDTAVIQEATGFNTQLNSQIEQGLQDLKGSNRFSQNVDETTTLEKIKGKFVIVMDGKSTDGSMTDSLKELISLSLPITSIQSVKKLKQPEENTWNVVAPIDENGALLSNNADYINTYRAYKMNASPVCMWESRFIVSTFGSTSGKTNLGDYEELFAREGSGFVI